MFQHSMDLCFTKDSAFLGLDLLSTFCNGVRCMSTMISGQTWLPLQLEGYIQKSCDHLVLWHYKSMTRMSWREWEVMSMGRWGCDMDATLSLLNLNSVIQLFTDSLFLLLTWTCVSLELTNICTIYRAVSRNFFWGVFVCRTANFGNRWSLWVCKYF